MFGRNRFPRAGLPGLGGPIDGKGSIPSEPQSRILAVMANEDTQPLERLEREQSYPRLTEGALRNATARFADPQLLLQRYRRSHRS